MQADPTLADWNAAGADCPRSPTTPPEDARWHRTVLAGVFLFLVAGLFFDVEPDESIGLAACPAVKLPALCPSRRWFGFACPGCGMTRSLTHLLHGRLTRSFAAHRLGWLTLAAILLQIPYRTWRLTGRRSRFDSAGAVELLLWGFVILLFVNWLLPR